MDSSTSKAQLRSHIRSARADRARAEVGPGSTTTMAGGRAGISPTEVGPDTAATVADAAWELISSRPVRSLLAYAALPGEPDLDPAIDRFLVAGGTVFLPVVTKLGEPLEFGEVTESMATLEPQGKWGIREPQGDTGFRTAEELLTAEVGLDLIFVPALGFSVDGARLGNGGGFYDRTFGPHGVAPLGQEPQAVGVCFASELALTGLIAEDWDLRIPAAVTETGLHTFDPN